MSLAARQQEIRDCGTCQVSEIQLDFISITSRWHPPDTPLVVSSVCVREQIQALQISINEIIKMRLRLCGRWLSVGLGQLRGSQGSVEVRCHDLVLSHVSQRATPSANCFLGRPKVAMLLLQVRVPARRSKLKFA